MKKLFLLLSLFFQLMAISLDDELLDYAKSKGYEYNKSDLFFIKEQYKKYGTNYKQITLYIDDVYRDIDYGMKKSENLINNENIYYFYNVRFMAANSYNKDLTERAFRRDKIFDFQEYIKHRIEIYQKAKKLLLGLDNILFPKTKADEIEKYFLDNNLILVRDGSFDKLVLRDNKVAIEEYVKIENIEPIIHLIR